jgi:SAM-dependent methyltransferase
MPGVPQHPDWLDATWAYARPQLPPPPATVLEVGCGPDGGLVPQLLADGYDAAGVDPVAPAGDRYHQVEFEQYQPPQPAGAVIAVTSMHHVSRVGVALDLMRAALRPGGTLVLIEWASERFDEPTARWCFGRLGPLSPGAEPGWLHRHRDRWAASGQPWPDYLAGWLAEEGLHPGELILREANSRFQRQTFRYGPFVFADLDGTSEQDEQAAIDAGQIQATGIWYTARLPS